LGKNEDFIMFSNKADDHTAEEQTESSKPTTPTKKTGTAYLLTYPADKGLGHTALAFQEDARDPESPLHHLSLYPANRRCSVTNNVFKWPVPGKLIENPEQDAKYEQSEPDVLQIEGVDANSMLTFKKELQKDLTKQHHLFTLGHNSHNPLNYFRSFLHFCAHTETKASIEPELNPFPTSDDLIIASPKKGAKPLGYSNCAAVAEECLQQGGLEVKHHEHPMLNACLKTLFSRTPQTTQAAVLCSGGKKVEDMDKLPKQLQATIDRGRAFAKARSDAAPPSQPEDAQEVAINRVKSLS
jgi:hypothetical protein